MPTAHANNAPLVGYYKFTARDPRNLAAADGLMKLFGFTRVPSWRFKKPKREPRGTVVHRAHGH